MRSILSEMKNMRVLENGVTVKSSVKDEQIPALMSLRDEIVKTMQQA